ncbi:TfuA-like protein [Polyangium mundeleinium]|uniref:TfuA-like protein n=1 Tax=Polyangium mundeleinium TaxID=2995306 RepID=A0ABT5F5M0_9BACT|nr:TfuA-like protein [Polyangium mundeleinium]MDC0749251.1 TfuA-like protein [Polyangium mundeleinium]
MKVHIFTGPTLSAEEGLRELDAMYRPPAAQGDVYHAAQEEPAVIGILDGSFEHVPSMAHKEVLWAMSRGIHVFGAASLGALRAAELGPFGMEGVGEIHAAYARGDLTDDDEVAVAHRLAEGGYRPVSEAMVNMRETLRRATLRGVITEGSREALIQAARELFYAERCYPAILASGRVRGVPEAELSALRDALPELRVDVKKRDALAMLRLIRERIASGLARKEVRFPFQHTDAWASITRRVHERAAPIPDERRS